MEISLHRKPSSTAFFWLGVTIALLPSTIRRSGKIIAYSHKLQRGQQCLGTRPLKNGSPLPMPRKKNFSPREIIVLTGFLNNSKEYHMGFTRKQKAKKLCAKKWSKKHIFLSHFFIFHREPKCMLKFLPNDFRVKIRKKGLSHSVQKHFPVSGHATLRVVWWCHEWELYLPRVSIVQIWSNWSKDV